ncbi:AmiR/NasT family two-component response regulator [Cellulomonas hominis]|uniref:AmiR/NasT family two-component response regulator n=1 Tax=Cellulomonas hominis TaxID=156981 RepID=A0A7W8SDV0_9CELL|nr:ANTAR domain-containing protein [Cellulomonas hominis]MBB5473287.1 AmiR/NasT family two-component response regulator [Cellulomonas hominis]
MITTPQLSGKPGQAPPERLRALRDELMRHDAVNQAVGLLMEREGRDRLSALHELVVESVRRDVTVYEVACTVRARLTVRLVPAAR